MDMIKALFPRRSKRSVTSAPCSDMPAFHSSDQAKITGAYVDILSEFDSMKISERGRCCLWLKEPNVFISKFKNSLAASIMSLAYFNVFKNTLSQSQRST